MPWLKLIQHAVAETGAVAWRRTSTPASRASQGQVGLKTSERRWMPAHAAATRNATVARGKPNRASQP